MNNIVNIIINNFNNNYNTYIYVGHIIILCYIPYLYLCMVIVSFTNALRDRINAEYEFEVSFSSKKKTNSESTLFKNNIVNTCETISDSDDSDSVIFDCDKDKIE